MTQGDLRMTVDDFEGFFGALRAVDGAGCL